MMFWILAIVIALLAAAYISWPLLKERAAWRNYGLALIVLTPVAALVLYQAVGTPAGIGVSGTPGTAPQQASHPGEIGMEIDNMVSGLERRLQDNPADIEGWVLLGRSYKTMQEFAKAEAALVRAIQLAPEDPLILVELAEARLYSSGSPTVSPEVRGMLEQALARDPNQQKGLWLLGIAAAQDGEDARALELWGRLSAQLEPGSAMQTSLQQQMAQVRSRSGPESAPQPAVAPVANRPGPDSDEDDAPPSGDGWSGLRVDVQAPGGPGQLPGNAALFIIVRNPDMPGPPLGVARMTRPTFPAIALISDANSIIENMPISAVEEVEIMARLSMSGNVMAQPEDWQSETVRVELAATGKIELVLAPR
jgi:cytochrome c-type biogenesis protein CcmH